MALNTLILLYEPPSIEKIFDRKVDIDCISNIFATFRKQIIRQSYFVWAQVLQHWFEANSHLKLFWNIADQDQWICSINYHRYEPARRNSSDDVKVICPLLDIIFPDHRYLCAVIDAIHQRNMLGL